MLLHAIGRMERPGATNTWLKKYIFPGGYTPALSEVLTAIEKVGLWVTDVEILRLHYAKTLRHWRQRFLANRERIKQVAGYDEFKILMNMSAMSKGTPSAGFYVLRSMKKYPLRGLALFGANGFMRGMATTVLGLARFSNYRIFEEEAAARLERCVVGRAPPHQSQTAHLSVHGGGAFTV
jgi:hypothetical protein